MGSVALTLFFFSFILIFITRCNLWGVGFARNGWKTWMLDLGLISAIGFSDIHIFFFSYIFIFITRCSLWIIEHVEEMDEKQFMWNLGFELQNGNWLHFRWNIFPFFIFVTRSAMNFSTYGILTNGKNGSKGLILNWGQIAIMLVDLIGIEIR